MSTARSKQSLAIRMMVESAILIGIALVINEFLKFDAPWAFGGSITLGSMVPIVLIAWRWGTRQGLFSALVFALLQLLLGVKNVSYGENALQVIGIALLDYVIAYTVFGLGGVFRSLIKNKPAALASGIVLAGALRFICHFVSGWLIWHALWPNDKGLSGAMYSLIYNGGYLLPDVLIALALGLLLFLPLKEFWLGEDLAKQ